MAAKVSTGVNKFKGKTLLDEVYASAFTPQVSKESFIDIQY